MKNIVLIVNSSRDIGLVNATKVAQFLLSQNCVVFMSDGDILPLEPIIYKSFDVLFEDAEMIITVGGDGTLLHCADIAARANIPILGINAGKLGYLTELDITEIDMLSKLFSNDYTVEPRSMLTAAVIREGVAVFTEHGLNDAVISRGDKTTMIELELCREDAGISSYRADGIIFSTSTGSTAYAMSAGGPIIDPRVNAILVTPICAHDLTSRPILFAPDTVLNVSIPVQRGEVTLMVDGISHITLDAGDKVTVKLTHNVNFAKIKQDNFYNTLKNKFGR